MQSVVGKLGKTTELDLNGNRFLLIQISISGDFYKLQLHPGASCFILKLQFNIALMQIYMIVLPKFHCFKYKWKGATFFEPEMWQFTENLGVGHYNSTTHRIPHCHNTEASTQESFRAYIHKIRYTSLSECLLSSCSSFLPSENTLGR